jgi:hypothetical protein
MTLGITDHVWSIGELLDAAFAVAPLAGPPFKAHPFFRFGGRAADRPRPGEREAPHT